MDEAKKTPPIERTRFHLAEHFQQNYFAQVPKDTDPRSLEDPAYFSNVANMCRPSGVIFAECEDGTWAAQLYIRAVGPQFVMARILNVWDFSDYKPEVETQTTTIAGYTVEWAGRFHKWRVVRNSDKAAVRTGEETKEAAGKWLTEHLKAIAA